MLGLWTVLWLGYTACNVFAVFGLGQAILAIIALWIGAVLASWLASYVFRASPAEMEAFAKDVQAGSLSTSATLARFQRISTRINYLKYPPLSFLVLQLFGVKIALPVSTVTATSYFAAACAVAAGWMVLAYKEMAEQNDWGAGEAFRNDSIWMYLATIAIGLIVAALVITFSIFHWWSPFAVFAVGFFMGSVLTDSFRESTPKVILALMIASIGGPALTLFL